MKKFSAILICLLMIVTCSLAGCATFSINKVKYYNEVIATVDETKITRFDLLTAYNNYGKSYFVDQQGESEKQALNSTLDLLIDREAMYQYALDNNSTYKPTEYQVHKIVQQIFDSVDEQMKSYVDQAKNILNIKTEEIEDETKEDETAYKLEDYTYSPRAEVKFEVRTQKVYYTDSSYTTKADEITDFSKDEEYNYYYIDYITPQEDEYTSLINEDYLTDFTSKNIASEIKTKYFDHFFNDLQISEKENANVLYAKARSLFAQNLIEYEFYLRDSNGKSYDKISENLFNRYFERTFTNQIKSQYLENIRVHYLENEDLSVEVLTQEYKYLANINYNLYHNNHEAYNKAMKDISTKGDTILYHPTTDAKFGYFIHTLISFDSIKDRLALLEEYQGNKDIEYSNIVRSIKVKARDLKTGLVPEDAEEVSLSEVLEEYNNIKNSAEDNSIKMSRFIQFMFKYTTDTATLSQGMPYVVGTNGYSSMVTEFTNEAIMLMTGKDSKGNTVIQPKAGNMSNANINDIDSLCITEYGIHLLYYIGDVNSFDIPYSDSSNVYIQDEDNSSNMYNLYTKTINPLTKKTYFDMMFDLVYPANSNEVYTSNNGYAKYEEDLTELSKLSHKVVKYKTKINATKTSL